MPGGAHGGHGRGSNVHLSTAKAHVWQQPRLSLHRCCSGMEDLFEMMQSLTFVQQLGYGILEILVVHLVPELKPLFRQLETGTLP